MSGEPIPRQDFWQGADPGGHILELDPQEQTVLRHMKDAVIPSGKHDQLVPVLLLELASPALPAHRSAPRAARSPCSRYAVARANISRVNVTCTRMARA